MYIVRLEMLQIGDILLDKHDVGDEALVRESKIIRTRAGSNYSHAYLYVGNGSVIESNVDGVQANNPQRKLYEMPDDVIVLRPKHKPYEFQTNVVEYSRRMICQGYADKDYRYTISKPNEPNEPNRQFCTRFVALAYDYAGVKITDNPHFANPRDIENSEALMSITDCLRVASEQEVEFANSDGVICHQAEYNYQMFNEIQLATGEDIQTIEQLVTFVIAHPEYDNKIADIIECSNYYSMCKKYEEENPWEFDAAMLIEHYGENSREQAENLCQSTINVLYDRHLPMVGQFKSLNEKHSLNTFKVFCQLYDNIIISDRKRLMASLLCLKICD